MGDEMFATLLFFGWVAIGGIVGYLIGASKGRGDVGFLLGAIFGFVGWIILLLLPEGGIKCPDCFGAVPIGARKCRHCGSDLMQAIQRADRAKAEAYRPRGKTMEQAVFTKCPCRRCGNLIEFDLMQFDRHNPPTIDCPHCNEPTQLFVNR